VYGVRDVHLHLLQHAGHREMPYVPGRGARGSRARHVTVHPDLAAAGFGIAVGHATDVEGATGLTVVRGANAPLRASAHVFGRATGTREIALLDPSASNERIDAILLTGGSAYGLDASAGVMRWMEERGRGFPIAGGVVPIVPAAVVFDLAPLGQFSARPTPEMAWQACADAATSGIAEGSVGAGTGCTVGKVRGPQYAMKGGFGMGVATGGGGVMAAAFAAVNAFGHVRGDDGRIIAGSRSADGTLLDTEAFIAGAGETARAGSDGHTTIAVVALNVALTKVELHQVARSASAAYARRLGPAGSSFDGDVIFAVSPLDGRRAPLIQAEVCATAALEQAIVRGVRMARGRDGVPGLAG
jgi:L-aminopeptidase/D-esterase-like protein